MKPLLLVIAFVLAGLTGSLLHGEEVYEASIDSDGVQRVEVLGGDYYFKPDYVRVKVNHPVEFRVKKESGLVPHNLVIHAPEAGIDIRESLSDDPKVVRFTPTKTGKYSFYCDKKLLFFASHREKGMEGILEVTE